MGPNSKTLLRQETVVTVRGVPLTSYMEAIILGTVSANAGKGRTAIEWVTERLENETKNLSERLEGIKLEVAELTHKVEDMLISAAKHSIEELQTDLMKIHPPIVKAERQRRFHQQEIRGDAVSAISNSTWQIHSHQSTEP